MLDKGRPSEGKELNLILQTKLGVSFNSRKRPMRRERFLHVCYLKRTVAQTASLEYWCHIRRYIEEHYSVYLLTSGAPSYIHTQKNTLPPACQKKNITKKPLKQGS